MNYPTWFTNEQREAFDELRKIAAGIGSSILMVDNANKDTVVMIDIPRKPTSDDWDAIEEFNVKGHCLFAEFATENAKGDCYEVTE